MLFPVYHINRPGMSLRVTLQVFEEEGQIVCGLRYIDGHIGLPPKATRSALTEELSKLEGMARAAGCTEMRHAGEDRAWCLPGYDPMPELQNGRRKRL